MRIGILLLAVEPQYGIHKAVKMIKGKATTRILRAEFSWLKSRIPTLWTNSYFVSTAGGAPLAMVKQYIEDQKRSGGDYAEYIKGYKFRLYPATEQAKTIFV